MNKLTIQTLYKRSICNKCLGCTRQDQPGFAGVKECKNFRSAK